MSEIAFVPEEFVTLEVWKNNWIVEIVRDEKGRFITWSKVGEFPPPPPSPLKLYEANFDIRWDYPR